MSLQSEPGTPEGGDRAWSPSELAELVIGSLDASGHLTPASAERLWRLMRRFGTFVERAHGLQRASEIGPEHVHSFLVASTGSGSAPSVATMHLRRTAIRLLFREAAKHSAVTDDPTARIELPARSYLSFRPLADEIELGVLSPATV